MAQQAIQLRDLSNLGYKKADKKSNFQKPGVQMGCMMICKLLVSLLVRSSDTYTVRWCI